MKKNYNLTLSALILLILSCSKDEYDTTGKLNLFFHNHSLTINVHIKAVENTDVTLYTFEADAYGKVDVDLNPGNYYLTVSAYNDDYVYTYYEDKGFQIRLGQTTSITWGTNNGIED